MIFGRSECQIQVHIYLMEAYNLLGCCNMPLLTNPALPELSLSQYYHFQLSFGLSMAVSTLTGVSTSGIIIEQCFIPLKYLPIRGFASFFSSDILFIGAFEVVPVL
jgi:hypothetical protein